IVVTGREADRFAAAALKLPFVDRIVLRASSAEALPASHPAQAKLASGFETAAFVCVGERCSLPVANVDGIAAAVAGMRRTS
ncbi:MAG TPA: thioredoxin domain-containing protein, partial [Pseudolabrys sp.]|nr:thioredoxin domain-containing protein [Pseudolabrys sp.]